VGKAGIYEMEISCADAHTACLPVHIRFGIVDLFDYNNERASAVDFISDGLYGIRLPDTRVGAVISSQYLSFVSSASGSDIRRDVYRRLCATISAQVLMLLDAFIFPNSLDEALPASQLHGLALVRNSDYRLGSSQGPLISSTMRLSLLLLGLLEPCSVKFLQCVGRMRCLLHWALELIREAATDVSQASTLEDSIAFIDRLILATVIHCHRALSRCASLLSEIESPSGEKYFESHESQKKHKRRLLLASLELREIVSTSFRGRMEIIRLYLSLEAFEALRESLVAEPVSPHSKSVSKESLIRDFLSSPWVTGFQDVDRQMDLAIPEQLSMEKVFRGKENQQMGQGLQAVEVMANESNAILSDFEKSLNSCFDNYLESQRKWTETDAVRDLEADGDATAMRLSEKYKMETSEVNKPILLRRNGADNRWRGIEHKAVEPFAEARHWKLAPYTDRLGRRTVLVPNRHFDDHAAASYEQIRANERATVASQTSLIKEDFSDVMRRNADAFKPRALEIDEVPHICDWERSVDGGLDGEAKPDYDEEYEEDWDKIDAEEIKQLNLDIDAWAKAFIWSEDEAVVARFDSIVIVSLQSFVEGKLLLSTHGLYFHQTGEEMGAISKEPVERTENDSKVRRWRLARLSEIHGRRYMLRPQALELFFSDSHELFLNFSNGAKDRNRFHAKLRSSCKVSLFLYAILCTERLTGVSNNFVTR
jgi:hypothetical protein